MDKVEDGFTPGPWKAEQGTLAHAHRIVITADHAGMRPNTPLAGLSDFDDAAWHDARLIAAAPDMYAALERLEAHCRILPPDMDQPGSPLAQARAALLLARKAGDQS